MYCSYRHIRVFGVLASPVSQFLLIAVAYYSTSTDEQDRAVGHIAEVGRFVLSLGALLRAVHVGPT